MTVEVAAVKRADMTESLTVVGNLIGAATVEAVPKVSGRLDDVTVRLGDRVRKGQTLAKVEDREIRGTGEAGAGVLRRGGRDDSSARSRPRGWRRRTSIDRRTCSTVS